MSYTLVLSIPIHRPTPSSSHIHHRALGHHRRSANAPQMASSFCCHMNEQLQRAPPGNASNKLSNPTSLSQHFLMYMPDVEQKYSTLESSIRANCSNPDNAKLQAQLKDMLEVVANRGRIAEGFACSTGLRLIPVHSNAKRSSMYP